MFAIRGAPLRTGFVFASLFFATACSGNDSTGALHSTPDAGDGLPPAAHDGGSGVDDAGGNPGPAPLDGGTMGGGNSKFRPLPSGQPLGAKDALVVKGNEIVDQDGRVARLYGFKYSALTRCEDGSSGASFFNDGPEGAAALPTISAWHATVVRIPLNEECWLGINGLPVPSMGTVAAYRKAVEDTTAALNGAGYYVILDLHLGAPGKLTPQVNPYEQPQMANRDHSIDFWTSVGGTFKDKPGVLFELFNEPFLGNTKPTSADWACLRDGGCMETRTFNGTSATYVVAGMQELVNAVRKTGAKQLLLSGGLAYTHDLSQWSAYAPKDPLDNVAATFHSHPQTSCTMMPDWDSLVGPTLAKHAVLATEVGVVKPLGDCGTTYPYDASMFAWADAHGLSYVTWSDHEPDAAFMMAHYAVLER